MGAIKFRVVIDTEKEEDIFRDILIKDELTFENFFHAIMSSFDFEGSQLASFYLSNDNWDKGREIGLMDMGFDESEAAGSPEGVAEGMPLVMGKTLLKDIAKDKGQKMILVYDFLNMWCFLIELIEFSDKEVESAELLMSVGVAPAEEDRQSNIDPDEINLDLFDDELDDDEDLDDFENIDDLDI